MTPRFVREELEAALHRVETGDVRAYLLLTIDGEGTACRSALAEAGFEDVLIEVVATLPDSMNMDDAEFLSKPYGDD